MGSNIYRETLDYMLRLCEERGLELKPGGFLMLFETAEPSVCCPLTAGALPYIDLTRESISTTQDVLDHLEYVKSGEVGVITNSVLGEDWCEGFWRGFDNIPLGTVIDGDPEEIAAFKEGWEQGHLLREEFGKI